MQGDEEEVEQIRQGLAAVRATGAELGRAYVLAWLAETYGKMGRTEEGLSLVAEGLETVNLNEGRVHEAELHRLKGQLTLQSQASPRQVKTSQDKSEVASPQHPASSTQAEAEAEACFQRALDLARRQSAKALELRTAMSLSRLWQQQGKKDDARQMLAEIYGWFTEGFDTADLQEAKVLLEELKH